MALPSHPPLPHTAPQNAPCPDFCQVIPWPNPQRGGRQLPPGQLCRWEEGAGQGGWDTGQCSAQKGSSGSSPHRSTVCLQAPSPSPLSPSVTPIYYGQDLPIKLFSNPLPSPPLLCVHSGRISPKLPPCQALPASPGQQLGTSGDQPSLRQLGTCKSPGGGTA